MHDTGKEVGKPMDIAIVGGGIAGLALALNLHARGIGCRIFEKTQEVGEVGAGITLLPHAMAELDGLGLSDAIAEAGVLCTSSHFFNRFGQKIHTEKRGQSHGSSRPEVCIHRGRLHAILLKAVRERLGEGAFQTGHLCQSVSQTDDGVTIHCLLADTGAVEDFKASAAVACDGVNSAVRKTFYPNESLAFTGINTWRGLTWHKPILDGASYLRIGSIKSGKLVVYPVTKPSPDTGLQLINWVAEVQKADSPRNDWNKRGSAADFSHLYASWRFDWLDAYELLNAAESIFEYPMVDKDPISRWTFGRVTFAGDAAHPMYPRGSNGAAQSLIDVRVLADALVDGASVPAAFQEYENRRRETVNRIVVTNRSTPPDYINMLVEERTGDHPFDDLDKYITSEEIREVSESYRRLTGNTGSAERG